MLREVLRRERMWVDSTSMPHLRLVSEGFVTSGR